MNMIVMTFSELTNLVDFWAMIIAAVGFLVAFASLIVTIRANAKNRKRESTIQTMHKLIPIRDQYTNMRNSSDEERKNYLRNMEYFATGVNNDVYSIQIVNKMSGGLLVRQYDDYLREYIEEARRHTGVEVRSEQKYYEYEKMIQKLKRIRMKKR